MSDKKCVFVTGGAGYIGSHCCVELLNAGYDVIAIDNFANSRHTDSGEAPSLKRVEEITGKKLTFYQCDLLDINRVDEIFSKHHIDYVIHFAAIKAVGESMQFPLKYYKNNVIGTINLVEVMKEHNVYQMVFSSSCCVYGDPEHLPITEDHPTGNVTNVYGRTKYLIEEMLKDLTHAEPRWNIISLRYFNPVGAHPSGRIGEDPTKNFSNLMPYIAQVALGNKPHVEVFGGDYNTPDGTGVRDYIHIMDLASGHVAALSRLSQEHFRYKPLNLGLGRGLSVLELLAHWERVTGTRVPHRMAARRYGDVPTLVCDGSRGQRELSWTPRYDIDDSTYNLGTGEGVSVKQLAAMFERVTGRPVPCAIRPRRAGDIVSMFANATLAREELGWTAKRTLEDMCRDMWRWQTQNPRGYQDDCDSPATNGALPASKLANGAGLTNGATNGATNGVSTANGVSNGANGH